jgi:hypothetical protein
MGREGMTMELKRVPTLRATVCQIERGLFRVSYQIDTVEWDAHRLPIYQVGSSVSDAKQRIEEKARGCGFAMVVWEDAFGETTLLPGETGIDPPQGGVSAGE